MKRNFRKEVKIGTLLIAVYIALKYTVKEAGTELIALDCISGGLIGLAVVMFILGLLPEQVYLKVKSIKKRSERSADLQGQ